MEIFDKIIIDFNLIQPSNNFYEISFKWCGNLIVLKLIQYEKILFSIIVKFVSSSNVIFSKFENSLNALFPISEPNKGIEIDFNLEHP